jgi:hypothetical protein
MRGTQNLFVVFLSGTEAALRGETESHGLTALRLCSVEGWGAWVGWVGSGGMWGKALSAARNIIMGMERNTQP